MKKFILLFGNTLANDYLKKTKSRQDTTALKIVKLGLIILLKLLHPFYAFVTESMWQQIKKDKHQNRYLMLKNGLSK